MTADARQPAATLRGARVGVTAARKGAELASLLERRGAEVMLGPTLGGDVAVPDEEVLADTRTVLDADPAWLVASTGVGMRMWAEVADRGGLGDELRAQVGRSRCIARGAKAVGGLVPLGTRPEWVAPDNTDREVVTWLRDRVRPGEAVAVQQHGGHPKVYDVLSDDGVEVLSVLPYQWSLPDDVEPARELVRRTIAGDLDLVVFTSAGGVSNLFILAGTLGDDVAADLRQALAGPVAVASIGPVTADAVESEGGANTVVPKRWRTADLVRAVEDWWTRGGPSGPP